MGSLHRSSAEAFNLTPPALPISTEPKSVLVTGAAGHIGSYFATHSPKHYRLRLMVGPADEPRQVNAIRRRGEVVEADLDDLARLQRCCDGMDTVVHLAANPSPQADWDSLLPNNIVGTYNLFAAARAAGCRRVIYASSIHAVSGYPPDVQVKPDDPVNPGDLYGVTKCFGEALARYMSRRHGLSAVCLRIGAFQPPEAARKEGGEGMMDTWVSQRDLHQLICRCIDAVNLNFAIFHGLSDNRFKRMDISNARQLVGYAPKDDLTELNELLQPLNLRQKTAQS